MRVYSKEVKAGFILKEDVFVSKNVPLLKKDTVLEESHLEILEVFLVESVEIVGTGSLLEKENSQNERSSENSSSEVNQESSLASSKTSLFLYRYKQAVTTFTKLSREWVNKEKVDSKKLEGFFTGLVEEMDKIPPIPLFLNQYSIKEDYPYHHAVSTGLLSYFISKKMGYTPKESIQIAEAAALCDVGMLKIGRSHLDNKGILTEKEYEIVKKHPYVSYKMVRENIASNEMVLAVLQHHEREDGSGYPTGVKSDQIHPFSQIVAVADAYHAMTTNRPYRLGQSPFKAVEDISLKNFGKFSPKVTETLLESLITLSTGLTVKLNNGKKGKIVFIDDKAPSCPVICMEDTEKVIQLSAKDLYTIKEVVVWR
ncbi:HD-GYP domain-containing protein [Thalassorhabdus alkalitolerans]|uniref:HD-GYP domain-containing protein n=1 Tax=Thalassorhabdus alkalitolerans TaxID=2282697 RepID=A0ABW0YGU2_9BACI